MFWNQETETEAQYQVPDDVFDLVFKVRGTSLDIDHAFALSSALQGQISDDICARIGVHGVRMAESGNGWNRPEHGDAALPLSRRARLAIRVQREDSEAVGQIMDKTLQIGHQEVVLGSYVERKLSTIGTLYARAICCDREQSEAEFLTEVANLLLQLNIKVSKMICGRCGEIRTVSESIFTRALMVADLDPAESVTLQQQGLGAERLLGCGLFVPHKGIDPVFDVQE
jgi:CRISPR-associated protein Cas6